MEVRKGAAATLRFPEVGDDAVTLSEPTVTVVRDSDGETLVDAKKAEEEEEGAFFTLDLAGSEIPEVDLLTVTWADQDSTYEQKVEVVGGFACSIAAIKKKLEEEAEDLPSDAEIEQAREMATQDIEAACWDAFRYRYHKETLSGDNSGVLILNRRHVLRVLSLVINDDALSKSEISEIDITNIGLERNSYEWPHGWPTGHNNIVIAYVYGHESFVSARGPVIDLAADYLVDHPNDWQKRATSYTDSEGNNYKMVTAGERGARFNVPSVNAFVGANEVTRLL